MTDTSHDSDPIDQQANTASAEDINAASEGLPPGEARTLAALAHGLGIIAPIVAPLIIWLAKKDALPAMVPQCKEAINFQLTFHGTLILLACAACLPTLFIPFFGCLSVPLLCLVLLTVVVFQIIATVSVFEGRNYQYPFRIPFIK